MRKQKKRMSDRTGPSEAPRDGQDSYVTGEGMSETVKHCYDDGTYVPDCSSGKQSRRHPKKKKENKRQKAKRRKRDINIAAWNIRTMKELGKLELLLKELDAHKINIIGLSETRWNKDGIFIHGNHTIVHSGSEKGGSNGVAIVLDKHHAASLKSHNAISDRIVMAKLNTKPAPLNIIQVYAPTSQSTEEEIEKFYNDLQTAKDKIPSREICVIMGDLNAKVGEGEDKESGIGQYGLGRRNERGTRLATFCQANSLTITNTLFKHPNRRRYTWTSPADGSRHQIDYIMIDQNWKTSVLNAKSRPGVDCETDHILIAATLRLKAYKRQNETKPAKYDLGKLKDPEIISEFQVETNNRFSVLLEDWKANETLPDEIWEDVKKVYTETAESTLGRLTYKPSKPYISDEVFQLAKEKSQARKKNRTEDYKRLKKEIRTKIRRDKKAWIEEECSKITEANEQRKTKEMFQQISKMKNTNVQGKNQSILNKEGETLTEMEDVLSRWHEYGRELFETSVPETSEDFPCLNFQEKEPAPLVSEVRAAIHQLKSGKSPGLDNVPGELLKSTGETGVIALHHLCTRIWETCQWPEDWKTQEFVMLHKNGNTKDCSNYRTIALISHISKVLLIIILNRMRQKVEEELSDCQAGYRSNRGTIDMLFVLQILIEKVKNSEQEAFITFIDYSKAFDSVIHYHLFDTMTKMGFPKHLVSLIAALYKDQKATIRWNGAHSEYFKIQKGVRQGCILSPHLFNLYTEQVIREADLDGMGIKIGGRNITNLRYADDTALTAGNFTSMKRILYRVDAAGCRAGLRLNAKKTKVMHIANKGGQKHPNIQIDKTDLENVHRFKYLGSIKSNDGSCSQDVKTRIGMAKQKMVQLNSLWKDRGLPTVLKLKILKTLIWPVLTYGCEAWTLRKDEENRINAAEMWLYRRLLRVKWTDRRTNDSVLQELNVKRQLLTKISGRKLKYVGHSIRHTKTDLMSTVLQGKVEAKRRKGRPHTSYHNNITAVCGLGLQEVAHRCLNRSEWREIVSSCGSPTADPGDGDE